MNVNLGQTFDDFINNLVNSGLYQSQSEVVRDGLRLLKEREDLKQFKLHELRRELAIGLAQSERGESRDFNPASIKSKGQEQLAKRRKSK